MVSIPEREPHQFSHRQLIVLTCPLIVRDFSDSLIHCSLAVAQYWAPRKHPQSLSYSLDMRRSRRRTPDRVFRISAKAHALAMQGRQPPMGGQSLIIRGLALESSYYPVSSGYLFSGRHRISDVSLWEPTVWTFASVENCCCYHLERDPSGAIILTAYPTSTVWRSR